MNIEFSSNPLLYWLAGYTIALLLCILIYAQIKFQRTETELLYLISGTFLLVWMRIPVILFNRELNADESQMLSQGMTLFHDPVYWRSVDGTTGGPLGSYFLIIPALFRGVFDYTTAHSGALILVFVALISFYFALRNWFGKVVAMACLYPLLVFFAFTQQSDFVHYSSEHLPVALMGIITYILSVIYKSKSGIILFPILLGSLTALLPFGKLQTLPMVFILVLWSFYIFWERRKLFNEGLWFIAGGLGTLAILAILMVAGNVFQDFLTFYIQGNLQYGGDISWWDNILVLPANLLLAPTVILFLIPQIVLVLFVLFSTSRQNQFKAGLFIFPLLWVLFTLLAISRTGSGYLHYWLFALIPIALFFANYLVRFQTKVNHIFGFCIFTLLCCVVFKTNNVLHNVSLNQYVSNSKVNRELPFTDVAKEILKYGNRGDYLAVWGWNCQFYVETQMLQGIAENHSIRSIYKHPMQNRYLSRYVSDLKTNKPIVIVDAVGKNSLWVQDKPTQGVDNYPVLAEFINHHYALVAYVDDTRLYVRKDRL
ncbi:hypothetical protein [Dyadobacter sp. NIV53]|uniref:hypothetical protein n=1 Tax=Dyadobacter sp. NIV53 TaxID=2861765 RepID=UPI001C85D282|nr:hypothetical protein [Dyadobacter sp. NIV53]